MKLPRVAVEFIFVATILATVTPGRAADSLSPWESMKRLPKKHTYTVLNRDGSCLTGEIVSVDETKLVLEQDGEHALLKAEVLRVSNGEKPDVHTAVYSARSSWLDIEALQTPPYYSSLLIFTTDDRQFEGRLIGVTSDQLTLLVNGKEMRFAKEFLARIMLTGKKATFDESGPHWNPIGFSKKILAPMQPIPLYEVTLREDNARIECKGDYRRRPQ